jgi:signal peptidase II
MRLDAKARAFSLVALGAVLLDQLTKAAVSRLPLGADIALVPGVLSITHARNTGAAFSMFHGQNAPLIIVTLAVLAGIAWHWRKMPAGHAPYWALIVGGAIGNLIDRVRIGGVTDFIAFSFWPAFNVADVAVTLGALLLAYRLWREK